MGSKYMASCSTYPYKGYSEKSIQDKWFIPFLFKVVIASRKYKIITVQYRGRL